MNQLTVVISQSPGNEPQRRALEEKLLTALLGERGVSVAVVSHVYGLREDDSGLVFLRSTKGPLAMLGWLHPRAIHWTLHALGVQGLPQTTQLPREATPSVQTAKNSPPRPIWSLDFKDGDTPEMHLAEIRRIVGEMKSTPALQQIVPPARDVARRNAPRSKSPASALRWYPVIDYGRCSDCMECIDFCLFGVYGVDDDAHLLVETPDSCRKGCPACSRVCPENAILFPMRRMPAISGASGVTMAAAKLDLSQLFGGPEPAEVAARERDAALAEEKQAMEQKRPKDDLDKLMDSLDDAKL